ncbi:hypothetical protein V8G54_022058 [Vigna mungo]|uniref:Trafficking protein particle complex subunit n=1 Tax=Vigna mungo TaxID=3915 RepID=A0AAQ3NFI8_VIGMU
MIGVGKAKQYGNVLDKPLAKGKQEVSLSAFAFLFSELVQYNQTQVDNIGELERRLEDAGYAVGARVLELLCHRDKLPLFQGFITLDGLKLCMGIIFRSMSLCLESWTRKLETEERHGCWVFFLLYTVQCGKYYLESMLGWVDHHHVMFTCLYKESPIIDETLVLNEPVYFSHVFYIMISNVSFGNSYVADSLEKGTEHEDEYMISEKELLVNKFISIPKDMGTFNCGAFVAGIVRGVLDGAGFPAVVTAHFVPMEGQQRPRTTILIKFAEEVLQREARLG